MYQALTRRHRSCQEAVDRIVWVENRLPSEHFGFTPLQLAAATADRRACITDLLWLSQPARLECNVVREAGGIEALVAMLDSADTDDKINALSALANLCVDRSCCDQFVDSGGISRLVPLLGETDGAVLLAATLAVANVAAWVPCRELLRQAGAVPLLVKVLGNAEFSTDLQNCSALYSLATNPLCHQEMRQCGILPLLREAAREVPGETPISNLYARWALLELGEYETFARMGSKAPAT